MADRLAHQHAQGHARRLFAQQTGRAVAFSLAAFRQAFNAGKDLGELDNVLIAAAACELHPNAVLKAIDLQSTKDRLKEATQEAYERGVRGVPTIAVGDQLFWGDDRLEEAAQALDSAPGVGRAGPPPAGTPHSGVSRLSTKGHRVLCLPMATREKAKAGKQPKGGNGAAQSDPAKDAHVGEVKHDLPDKETCETVLAKMVLIRRFEERAGEMYAKAKVGGFLHLCIGEEATVVGGTQALRDTDYLMSTYREHGQALARGTDPKAVMAELFGRETGCSKGRGGSMHLFDWERRFLGGYGIVGGSLPLSAGVALANDYLGNEDVILSMMGDGATNQGTFGETMNLAALWKLPVVFVIINNQFGMGTALHRHSAVTDLSLKSEGFGVSGHPLRRHGRARRPQRRHRRPPMRARGTPAAARRGRHVPLPRSLHGRPRGVPHQGGGRGVARARPDQGVRRPARRRGRAEPGGRGALRP